MRHNADLILPCRVTGTRLYGKPLQLIDIEKNISILEHLLRYFQGKDFIRYICLAISEEEENYGFIRLAEKNGWKYILGDPFDVLGRIVKAIHFLNSETIVMVSTENPFLHSENLESLYQNHIEQNYDYSMVAELPEGAAVSIIQANALKRSHEQGSAKHRSELVTSYIFDHQDQFKINLVKPDATLRRPDVRITVDYPEDLIFCRKIYQKLNGRERLISISDVIDFWDKNPQARKPVEDIGIDWGHGRLWD